MSLQGWVKLSLLLGFASLAAILVCQLALDDIAGGEADPRQEWWALRAGFAIILVFHWCALRTLFRLRHVTVEDEAGG